MENIEKSCNTCKANKICDHNKFGFEDCGNYIPEDVEEVKHGRWLPQMLLGVRAWDCSECKTLGSPRWKRCPMCEAKMDGGGEK